MIFFKKEELQQLRCITSHLDHLSGRSQKKSINSVKVKYNVNCFNNDSIIITFELLNASRVRQRTREDSELDERIR